MKKGYTKGVRNFTGTVHVTSIEPYDDEPGMAHVKGNIKGKFTAVFDLNGRESTKVISTDIPFENFSAEVEDGKITGFEDQTELLGGSMFDPPWSFSDGDSAFYEDIRHHIDRGLGLAA